MRELRGALPGEVLHPSFDGINAGIRLEIPSIKTHLTVRLEDKEDTFEGRNYEEPNSLWYLFSWCVVTELCFAEPSEVVFLSGKNTQFLDYVPGSIIGLAVTSTFCAAALEDGSVNVYSPTGRR